VLFTVLVWLWRRRSWQGQVFLAAGALYGFVRALIEILRDDQERGFFFGLSTSQIIGVSTGIVCVGLYLYGRKHAPRAQGASIVQVVLGQG
jgi:prolipoprotein diacylglyceryltransferase